MTHSASWRTLSRSTKASQAMSMAESEGLGVQVLWTSLTRKRHCSAYSIRTEATLRSLGRTGGHKPVNNLQDLHNLVLGWSDGLCHRVRKQRCPGDFNILGRKPQKTITTVCDVCTTSKFLAGDSSLLDTHCSSRAKLEEERDRSNTTQSRQEHIAIACHGIIYDSDLIFVDLGWKRVVDRHSLG
jgi:hypothetical protein